MVIVKRRFKLYCTGRFFLGKLTIAMFLMPGTNASFILGGMLNRDSRIALITYKEMAELHLD